MPNMHEEFNAFFKKEDLTGPLTLTIQDVKKIEIGRDENLEEKWAVFFVEDRRGVTLNKTRKDQLVEITDSAESDDWIGKRVRLVIDPGVKYQGKKVGGLAFEAP